MLEYLLDPFYLRSSDKPIDNKTFKHQIKRFGQRGIFYGEPAGDRTFNAAGRNFNHRLFVTAGDLCDTLLNPFPFCVPFLIPINMGSKNERKYVFRKSGFLFSQLQMTMPLIKINVEYYKFKISFIIIW